MKRLDAFKRIVLALAVIGLTGCSANRSEKRRLNQQISDAKAKEAEAIRLINENKRMAALISQDQAQLLEQIEAWNKEQDQREEALKSKQDELIEINARLESLRLDQENLTASLERETEILLKKRAELTEAEALLQSQIQQQRAVVAQAEAEKARLLAEAEAGAGETAAAAAAEAQAVVDGAQAEAEQIVSAAEKDAEGVAAAANAQAEERLAEVSAQEALVKSKLEELEAQKEDLEIEERDLAQQEASLRELSQTLEAKNAQLEQGLADLAQKEADFQRELEAARALFIANGRENIFKGLLAGRKYPFMISIVGTGDYSVLKSVREAVKKQTSETRYKMHNMQNPLTSDSEETLSQKDSDAIDQSRPRQQVVRLQDGRYFIKDIAEDTSVNVLDTFLTEGDVVSLIEFEREINKAIDVTSKRGEQGANFWVSVRPIEEVVVSAELEFKGSKGYGMNREKETFQVSQLKDLKTNLADISDVDLLNLSKSLFGSDNTGCESVDAQCLVYLQNKNLLSVPATKSSEVNVEESIYGMIATTIRKMELEKQFPEGDLNQSLNVLAHLVPVTNFWGRETGEYTYEVNEEASAEEKEKIEKSFQQYRSSKNAYSLEEIVLKLSVKAITKVSEGRIGMEVPVYMGSSSIADGPINTNSVAPRDYVVIPLPIRSENGANRVYSVLPDLNMDNYATKRVAPEQPVRPIRPEVTRILQQRQLQADADALREEAAGIENEDSVIKAALLAQADFREAMQAYVDEVEAMPEKIQDYQVEVEKEKAEAYLAKLEELKLQLEAIKKALLGI